jgi:hypothetical protein
VSSIFDKRTSFGWPRSQRFQLSGTGFEAESSYRETVTAARAVPGRASFDMAQSEWAARLGLNPSDGPYLGELTTGARTVQQIAEGLESCGSTVTEVRAVVTRLIEKGLLVPVAPPEEPPPRRYW